MWRQWWRLLFAKPKLVPTLRPDRDSPSNKKAVVIGHIPACAHLSEKPADRNSWKNSVALQRALYTASLYVGTAPSVESTSIPLYWISRAPTVMIRPKISREGRSSKGGPVGLARRPKPLFHLSSRITRRARLVIRSAGLSTLFVSSISKISTSIIANCRTALFSPPGFPVWTLLKSRSRIAVSPSSPWAELWPAPRETARWGTLKYLRKFRSSRYSSWPVVSGISSSFYHYHLTQSLTRTIIFFPC